MAEGSSVHSKPRVGDRAAQMTPAVMPTVIPSCRRDTACHAGHAGLLSSHLASRVWPADPSPGNIVQDKEVSPPTARTCAK